ncbi:MAG: HD-GYP domain-containing protein [Solirubrobacterales bacterium]
MRRISCDLLQPGFILGRTIYTIDGRVLLAAGTVLQDSHIDRFREHAIASVYITEELDSELPPVSGIVSEAARQDTAHLVRESILSLQESRQLNIRAVEKIVIDLIEELLGNPQVLVQLSEIRSYDDHTFDHSVNVGILSLMVGITMGLNRSKLKELGIGALLHDVGKIRVDQQILNKPGLLTADEYDHVKAHSELGFEMLRASDDVSLLAAHISYQHHERWDGNGYPRGLAGDQIHEYARIVATADVFDALMADRPYRPAYQANQAVTIINRLTNTHFEPRVVSALVSHVAVFPVGSLVALSSGEIGLVVDVKPDQPQRPLIRVIYDKNRRRLKTPHDIDMSRLTTVYISRVVSEREWAELRQNEQ